MSSKSAHHAPPKSYFSNRMVVISLIMIVVFGAILIIYPRIFNPSEIGKSTAPAPMSNTATTK